MNLEYPQQFGPYELLRPLGRGGMAEVFLAHARSSQGLKRIVALKRMHAGVSEDSGAVEMLIAEAKLAMRFSHPHIASTFELGCHAGAYYFIMEYVNGADVGTLASIAESLGERLDPVAVAHICVGVARALHHAHTLKDEDGRTLGVVHRDVSPQNVLINCSGAVKLIDFGVAKVATRIQQTMAGIIKGKYAYMSPEQASAEKVDARSDVFSLGICLHELLTGKPLFRGPDMVSPFAILRAVREEPITPVHQLATGVDSSLSVIVARALERKVEARYQSADELANALEAWVAEHAAGFNDSNLQRYVDDMVTRAPDGAVPQRTIATPPVASMMGHEFSASELSVVARSPLEAAMKSAAPPQPVAPLLVPPPKRPSSMRPSRKSVMQFLWVGLAAFIFAMGWSLIATLKRFGII